MGSGQLSMYVSGKRLTVQRSVRCRCNTIFLLIMSIKKDNIKNEVLDVIKTLEMLLICESIVSLFV